MEIANSFHMRALNIIRGMMNAQSLLAWANLELTRWKENTYESSLVSATSAEMAAGSWSIPAAPHTVRSAGGLAAVTWSFLVGGC